VYSFGPRARDNAGVLSKIPTAQFLQDHFSNESYRAISGQILKFQTDGKEENAVRGALENYLNQQAAADKSGNLPQYSAFTNNCSEQVCSVLRAGGLDLTTGFVAPGGVEAQLTDIAGIEDASQFRGELQNMANASHISQEIQDEASRQCDAGNPAACE
jgi:hypothetical protein